MQQMQVLREELELSRTTLCEREAEYASLHECFTAVHQSLSPLALAAAFSYNDAHTSSFSATPEQHRAQTERLFAHRATSHEDATAVANRVRELLQQTQAIYLRSEKQEVALRSEVESLMEGMRRQVHELQGRLAESKQVGGQ